MIFKELPRDGGGEDGDAGSDADMGMVLAGMVVMAMKGCGGGGTGDGGEDGNEDGGDGSAGGDAYSDTDSDNGSNLHRGTDFLPQAHFRGWNRRKNWQTKVVAH